MSFECVELDIPKTVTLAVHAGGSDEEPPIWSRKLQIAAEECWEAGCDTDYIAWALSVPEWIVDRHFRRPKTQS